jgi:tetratricopeptide (TPR) repeat protein
MDLVMTIFLVATLLALQRERWLLGSFFVLLAYGAKSTGVVYTLALLLTLALLAISSVQLRIVRRPHRLYLATFLTAVFVIAEYALIQWGQTMSALYADILTDKVYGIQQLFSLSLHITLLVLLPLVIGGWHVLSQRPAGRPLTLWLGRLLAQATQLRVEWFLGISLVGMLLAGQVYELIPRYFVSLATCGLLLLVALLAQSRQWIPVAVLAGCVLLNVTDVEARYWRSPQEHAIRRGTFEASYADLEFFRAEAELVRRIAAIDPEAPLVASGVYELYFGLPNLCYLEQPRSGYALKGKGIPGFAGLTQLMLDRPENAIFVGGLVSASMGITIPFPATSDDIIHQEQSHHGTVAYRKRWSTMPPDADEVFDWYQSWIFPHLTPGARIAALATVGRKQELLHEAHRSSPNPAENLVEGAGTLLHFSRYDLADQLAQMALDHDPHCADASYTRAAAALKQNQYDRAGPLLFAALEQQPGHPRAVELIVSLLLHDQQTADCLGFLQTTLQDRPDHLELWQQYARLLRESRNLPGIHQGLIDGELMRAEQVIPKLQAAAQP